MIDDDRGVATGEKFYKVGSTIELKCIIDKIPARSSFVIWKHGERMLNYDTSRGGIRYLFLERLFHLVISSILDARETVGIRRAVEFRLLLRSSV